MPNKKPAPYSYGYRRKSIGKRPLIMVPLLAAALALVSSAIWQLMDQTPYDPTAFAKTPDSSASRQEETSGSDSETSESPEEPPASGSVSDAPSSESEQDPDHTSSLPASSVIVPQGEWLPSSYFDDALFIGDSITEGVRIYGVMDNATILSDVGINLSTIFTKGVVERPDGSKQSIMDAAADVEAGKIYVLMGVNSLLSEKESFIAAYSNLITELQGQHPDALIYVQSILPVTAAYEAKPSAVTTNAHIDEYNQAILEMCGNLGVYYLDVASVFKDETGALFAEASPNDGIHFGRQWYMEWFDYLRSHGVQPDTQE